MRIILAAGGTGGHLFPAIALGQKLQQQGHQVLLVTDSRGGSYPGLDPLMPLRVLNMGRYQKGLLKKISLGFSLVKAFFKAFRTVINFKPDCIVGFGGFPSTPTLCAGIICHIPLIGYELNAYIGRVNRHLISFLKVVATSFSKTYGIPEKYESKIKYVGGIVRPSMIPAPYKNWQPHTPFCIVIIGGSQGAKSFDTMIPAAISILPLEMRQYIEIWQQSKSTTLEDDYKKLQVTSYIAPFFTDINALMQKAHLIIGRAGGSTSAELLHMKRPSILIPYPHAMDDHQYYNGKNIELLGGGWVVREGKNSIQELQTHLKNMTSKPDILKCAATALETASNSHAVNHLVKILENLQYKDTK